MDIQALKKLKEKTPSVESRVYKDTVVFGSNIWALAANQKIRESLEENRVGWLFSHRPLWETTMLGLSSLVRREDTVDYLRSQFPQAKVELADENIYFYKDQKFRVLGGRVKPLPFKVGEEFFTKPRVSLAFDEIFSGNMQTLCERSSELGEHVQLEDIIYDSQPKDIAEPAFWTLKTKKGKTFSCRRLIWADRPLNFYKFFGQKTLLSSELSEFCNFQKEWTWVGVTLEFNKEVVENPGTYLIPQSLTHEWGHFVGQVSAYKSENKRQKMHFWINSEENFSSSEGLAKKIRSLKSTLKRIFPAFHQALCEEAFTINEQSPCLNFDGFAEKNLVSDLQNISFTGLDAPMGDLSEAIDSFAYPSFSLHSFSRGIQSIQTL